MLFNSYPFLFAFLPVTLAGFFLLGRWGRREAALAWLVAASGFFYAWWNPVYLNLLVFSIAFNFGLGRILSHAARAGDSSRGRLLGLGVAVNLGLIGYFKYANFFIDTTAAAFGTGWSLAPIVLPLGISFFTFQQIAYLVDAHRGETHEYNFLHYCLFVAFFPQLIAGPIVHHRQVMPQFEREDTFRPHSLHISVGLTILAIGLFKKVIIADSLAPIASQAFARAEAGATLTMLEAWRGTIAYGLQIYFDFSGYSDMAIGLGRLVGITLPLNFHSPYRATSIIDFWRRWHMTLSQFLRDYVYIPLGGNRHGSARRYANVMATMLLGGLWHGAGWTFVLWGGLHGTYLLLNHGWRALALSRGRERRSTRVAGRVVTLLAVMVAWVLFRAQTLNGALAMWRGMVTLPELSRAVLSDFGQAGLYAIGWLAVLWWFPNTQQWMARFEPACDLDRVPADTPHLPAALWARLQWRPSAAWAAVAALISVVAVLGLTRVSEFLYFQF